MVRRLPRPGRLIALTMALALVVAACGDDDGNGTPGDDGTTPDNGTTDTGDSGDTSELSGSVLLDGSSTVAPFAEAAAELFESQSNVQVSVGTSGTGGGFEKFCNGETDISNASRDIKDEEADACEGNGIAFERLGVANDALAVLVNPSNPVDCLSVEQLNQIWAPGSTVSNWNEIDGVDFDAPLELYGPGTDSGTFDYFTEAINGEEGAQRTDYNNIGEDDNTGITGIIGSEGGMFYVGFSFAVENEGQVKALAIDGGDGCVEPSEESVFSGEYSPLARQLFMFPSDAGLAKPEVQAFLEFVIGNSDEIAQAAGFIGLTDDQAAEAQAKIASLVG